VQQQADGAQVVWPAEAATAEPAAFRS
jgi:hypothetical protein